MPRLYLDSSALQRPYDRVVDARAQLEAGAVVRLIALVEDGALDLAVSPLLTAECIDQMPATAALRAIACREVLRRARIQARLTAEVALRAREIHLALRLDPPDALHLAYAESVGAVLVSTDCPFLNKVGRSSLARTPVMDPMDALLHFGSG